MTTPTRKHAAARRLALVLLVGLSGGLVGASCGSAADDPNTVEVLTWWRKGGEAPALRTLVQLFEAEHPNLSVINQPFDSSDQSRQTIKERLIGGQPPETFQANGGWDLLAWVLYNNLDDSASKMEPLDDVANWATAIPDAVLDTVRYGAHVYAVPLNIHRVNTLFFNRKVFTDNGLDPPSSLNLPTLDQLFTLAETLRARGVTPLALGTKEPWTLSLLLFENILVARSDGTYYRNFFLGTDSVLTSTQVITAVDDLARLLSYDPEAGTRTWDTAIDEVRAGRAAMTIMGDWAKGYFLDKAREDEVQVDFGEIAMPGTAEIFIFTTDTFGLPRGARNVDGARQLLELFGSREGQDTFNPIKGSIAARKDSSIEAYDAMGRDTITAFRAVALDRTRLVPATAILAPPDYTTAINQLLFDFAGNNPARPDLKGNASVVLHGLQNWSDVLRKSPWH